MKKIMILPLVILLVCTSFFSGCVEEEEKDGETVAGVGTLTLQITDKPTDLDIVYANVTISMVQVHKAAAGDVDNNNENGGNSVANQVDGNLTADAGGNYSASTGELIQFEGNASGGVEPYNWSWNFGDGNTSDLKDPQHYYEIEGEYMVNLTVSDFNNSTAWDITYALIEEVEEDDGDGYAGWYTIVNESKTYDLIALQDVKDVLGSETLTEGKYTQIRLTIEEAVITVNNNDTLEEHNLKVPSGSIKLTKGFWIYEDETTVLTLDFDIHDSVHKTGSNKYILKPTIKIIQE
jgi:PKD repeat protein